MNLYIKIIFGFDSKAKEILGTYLKKDNDNHDSYSYAKSEILNYLNKNIKYSKKFQGINDYGNF